MVFDGIGEAVTPILSVYLGEKNRSGMRRIYRLAEKTAVVEGLVVTMALILCAPFIPGILNITDSVLTQNAIMEVRLIALGSAFVSLLYLLTSYYLVIDRIALGLVASALRDALLSVILAVPLGVAFGLLGMFAGLAAAPAAAYGLLLLYLRYRYGREDCPLLLLRLPVDAKSWLFDLSTEPEQIIALQKKAESLLKESDVDKRTVGRVKLLIEELFMLIREKNGEKAVLSECSILLRPDAVQIITKDDGILFDISEEDVSVTSLVALNVSAYMEKMGRNRQHLTTMSFNRSSFLIRRDQDTRQRGVAV